MATNVIAEVHDAGDLRNPTGPGNRRCILRSQCGTLYAAVPILLYSDDDQGNVIYSNLDLYESYDDGVTWTATGTIKQYGGYFNVIAITGAMDPQDKPNFFWIEPNANNEIFWWRPVIDPTSAATVEVVIIRTYGSAPPGIAIADDQMTACIDKWGNVHVVYCAADNKAGDAFGLEANVLVPPPPGQPQVNSPVPEWQLFWVHNLAGRDSFVVKRFQKEVKTKDGTGHFLCLPSIAADRCGHLHLTYVETWKNYVETPTYTGSGTEEDPYVFAGNVETIIDQGCDRHYKRHNVKDGNSAVFGSGTGAAGKTLNSLGVYRDFKTSPLLLLKFRSSICADHAAFPHLAYLWDTQTTIIFTKVTAWPNSSNSYTIQFQPQTGVPNAGGKLYYNPSISATLSQVDGQYAPYIVFEGINVSGAVSATKPQILYAAYAFTLGWVGPVFIANTDHNYTGPTLLGSGVPSFILPAQATLLGVVGVVMKETGTVGDPPSEFPTFDMLHFEVSHSYATSVETIPEELPPCCPVDPILSTLALGGEGASGGTYPVAPDFAFPTVPRYASYEERTEAGYAVSYAKVTTARRAFRVRHTVATAVKDTILAFLDARKGPLESFDFAIPPSGPTIKAKMVADTLMLGKVNPGFWVVELEIEEAF